MSEQAHKEFFRHYYFVTFLIFFLQKSNQLEKNIYICNITL